MPLNREFIGRVRTADHVYEVGRETIRDYALAIGDDNPIYLDAEAARAQGLPDVIAPPTFVALLFARLGGWPLFEPELGKDSAPYIVQAEQQTTHRRPVRPGDRLIFETTVDDIRDVGRHELITCIHRIATVEGELVATIVDTGISRGTAAAKEHQS